MIAACGGEGGAPQEGGAQISTLAYVTSSCRDREKGGRLSGSEAFWVRRGEEPPVKIAEFAWGQPVLGAPYCALYGQGRFGSSTCDPLGTNPHDGAQVFAMRPDGSGLRQLTATRGIIHEADQTISMELPGPFAVPSRLR
jgi:hypothetical protein